MKLTYPIRVEIKKSNLPDTVGAFEFVIGIVLFFRFMKKFGWYKAITFSGEASHVIKCWALLVSMYQIYDFTFVYRKFFSRWSLVSVCYHVSLVFNLLGEKKISETKLKMVIFMIIDSSRLHKLHLGKFFKSLSNF